MPKMYADDFTNERRLAWARSRSQARFRCERWTLTFAEFCQFWSTQELWQRRGRSPESLVLTRYDPEQAWSKTNCCILNRKKQIEIRNLRRYDKEHLHLYQDAIFYER